MATGGPWLLAFTPLVPWSDTAQDFCGDSQLATRTRDLNQSSPPRTATAASTAVVMATVLALATSPWSRNSAVIRRDP